ncbi:Coq4 family protein [Amphiplicatus metriothermophilus]|uniref:Ubiquinone biosynthesis protein COQ4 n=1 Tax=Amphiplicatus metriothermophilus TaxID=1519374 RepID=A0A239PZD4_9PROT|nr:Coq4 family protein [Amphiplicatus metriothermophilus]MBB5518164.1 ubiquinone biosynthesis protein COQ4 [Amphiplicatus metriothermophilus]SNT75326.1 ubiquinone biosynthesis protein COQ4 [Amphiplicatus metriothermophilus]
MMAAEHASATQTVPPEKIEWIGGCPTPPAPPVRPLHALVSVVKLVLNKEDTRQVFEAVAALSGRAGKRTFRRFVATPYGRRVVSEPVKLEEILSDRERLRAMPEGSFGRAYLAFMEGENLTPEGLIDSAAEAGIDFRGDTQFPEYRRLFLHLDVSHDLWHVLTGYGRDALGELCNLCFTRAQTRNPGFRLIIWIGLLAMKLERPGQPFWRAANEARRMGLEAEWIPAQDVEALLPLPLGEVRRRLNILAPTVYNAIPEEVKRDLLKPKVKKTQAQREAEAAMAG